MKNMIKAYIGLSLAASLLGAPAQQPPLEATFSPFNLPKTTAAAGMRIARGSAIITALGPRLPEVARFHGLTDTALGSLSLADQDLAMDQNGNLLFICVGSQESVVAPADAGTGALLNYPASQTLLLHSKPGQSRVIFLDFDGHNTPAGTPWNGGSSFYSPPYSTDFDPAFSAAELANIQAIWKQISEDYAPWDVDVTTEQPPLASLQRNASAVPADSSYGIRVVIGGNSFDWYGAGAGGVAYVHSFSWETDTPCYVFPAQLGSGWPKYVAEAASHEIGHTLSLYHDGVAGGSAYYGGTSTWAPIMGSGYYAATTQFSKGEYPGSNNLQDDTAVINSHIPRSTDLVGDAITNALPLSGTAFAVSGLIENRFDADLYRVVVSSGMMSFNAAPAAPDANLDIGLSLYDSAGNLIANSNPASLSASLSASVLMGTYYLAVDGVGSGSLDVGYSDYASLGQFTLTGSVPPAPAAQPPTAICSLSAPTSGPADLVVQFSSGGSLDPQGATLIYDWDFGDGSSSAEANPSHTYANPGLYSASLLVYNAAGLSAASGLSINVLPRLEPPVSEAFMTTPTVGLVPLTVQFSSMGSMDPEGGALSYHWDLGDGTSSTEPHPVHTYNTARAYFVLLTVTDPSGLTNTCALTITVFNPPLPPVPVASQSTPTSGDASLDVQFYSFGSYDPNQDAFDYVWNFGDGTTSTAHHPNHIYTIPGTYTATLTAKDTTGLSASTSLTITVRPAPRPPLAVVSQTTPTSGIAPLAVLFSSLGTSDPDGTPVSYLWQFGDNTSSTDPNPVHTYATPGNYTATLTVSDPTGLTAAASVAITAKQAPRPPVAAVSQTTPTSGVAPLAVLFSSLGTSDPDGTPVSYLWQFGDNTSSTDPNPVHTYATPGNYTATLTVTDPTGLTAAASVLITVQAPLFPPLAAAAATSPTTGTGPFTVQFSGDKSSDPNGDALSYRWNSGDGQSSTAANPSFTYPVEGTYLATLTVTDPTGLSNAATQSITVLNPANVLVVSALTISTNSSKTGTQATATVAVKDLTGRVRSNVTANGTWSGIVSGTGSAKTDAKGNATLTSLGSGAKTTGTFTFTLTSLSLAGATYGATYDPSLDARTTISIIK